MATSNKAQRIILLDALMIALTMNLDAQTVINDLVGKGISRSWLAGFVSGYTDKTDEESCDTNAEHYNAGCETGKGLRDGGF